MKKLLIFLLLGCSATAIFGQTRLQIETGWVWSNVRSKSEFNGDRLGKMFNGGSFGVRLKHYYKNQVNASISVSETLRGYDQPAVLTNHRLLYTDLHFLIGYGFEQNIGVSVGGFCGFLNKQWAQFNGGDWVVPVNGLFNKSDAGLVLEASYNWNALNFFGRYNYGVKSISNLEFTDSSGNVLSKIVYRDQFVQIGLGICLLKNII